MLAFVAALAAPLEAACGTACVEVAGADARARVEAPAYVSAPAEPSCHETPPAPAPEESAPEQCLHDHGAGLRALPRAASDAKTAQPAVLEAPADFLLPASPAIDDTPRTGPPGGSPPLRNLPLRI